MAKKAVITTFDSVRIEILSEEACARWFQYYPGEKDVIHSLLSKITINTDLSRAAFDTSKEEIFAEMMKTGTFKRQQGGNTEAKPSGTLRRMLSTQQGEQSGTPERRGRRDQDTPEKEARGAARLK